MQGSRLRFRALGSKVGFRAEVFGRSRIVDRFRV